MVDLHIHSDASDGTDSPIELIINVIENGINTFAVTDHDTLEGAKTMSNLIPSGIKYVPGVEISCVFQGKKVHILGLGIDTENPELNMFINKAALMRRALTEKRIKYLEEQKFIVLSEEEKNSLYAIKSCGKPHIAELLVKKGFAPTVNSAIKVYLEGCSSDGLRSEAEAAVAAIKKAGGIPVWAHPLGGEDSVHKTPEEFKEMFRKMLDIGIQGLECWYSRYSEEECRFLVSCAEENGMVISGGSDYHGAHKSVDMGTLNSSGVKVDDSMLSVLQAL